MIDVVGSDGGGRRWSRSWSRSTVAVGAAVQSGECSAGDASGQPHDGLPEMSGFTLNIQAITPVPVQESVNGGTYEDFSNPCASWVNTYPPFLPNSVCRCLMPPPLHGV